MKILDSVFSMLRAGGQVLAIRLVAILLQFGFVWYISTYLGDSVYGDFVIYLMITQFVGTMANLGLDVLIVKKIGAINPIDNTYNTKLVRQMSMVGVSLSVALTFLLVTTLYSIAPGYLPVLPMWTYLVGASFYGLMRLLVEYYRSIRWITLSTILAYLIAPTIAVIILWMIKVPAGALNALVVTWIIAMMFVIVCAFLIKLFYQWPKTESSPKLQSTKSLIFLSFPFLMTLFLVFLNGWVDKMVLRFYIESDVLGQYFVAYRLAAMIFLPLMAFNTLLAPRISEAYQLQKSSSQLRTIIWDVLRWAILFASIGFVLFVLLGKYLLGIFSEQHVLMYPVLLILSVGQLINVAAGPVGVVMKMTKLQNLYAKVMCVSVFVNFILNIILIPSFGVYGAALASAVGLICINVGAWWLCKQRLGLSTGVIE